MQLIYLYIDNYKNIQKQGFNFSSEYKCSFDGKVLNIKKQEYLNIFPDNVNINVVVGKNGSGKSNLLELLLFLLKDREYINSIKYILVFKQNNKLKYKKNKLNFQANNILEYYDRFGNNIILIIEHSLIKYTKNNLWYKKLLKEQELRDNENFYIKFPYLLNQIDKYSDCILPINKDIFFNRFILNIKLFNIDYFCNELKENKDYISLLIKKFITEFLQLNEQNLLQRMKIQSLLEKKVMGVDSILFYNMLFSILHFIYINKDFTFKQNIKEIIENLKSIRDKKNFRLDDIFEILTKIIFTTNDKEHDKYLINNIKTIIELFKYLISIKTNFSIILEGDTSFQYKYNINENNKIVEIIKNTYKLLYFNEDFISSFGIDFINYDFWFIDEKTNKTILEYKDLSNGEKTILSMITDIVYYINNHKEAKIVLFDEIDETLHPEWKRKLLSIILCIIKKMQRNVHIIFSTHSPFILSDIPKENIIFLEDGNNVSDKVDINTFGANIHTLLSHGFFMKDGLMGEFVRDEIEKVIKFLNSDKNIKLKKIKAWNIIQKIGEPFLKMKLEEMYANRFKDDISVLDKIRDLKSQIKRLQND